VAHCQGVDTSLTAQPTYSARDGSTGRVGGAAPGHDSQAVSESRRGEDSPFDLGARGVSDHLMPWSGEWTRVSRARGGLGRSREPLKGRHALERGGNSPEGASSPRARQKSAQGGVKPLSETEVHPRVAEAGCLTGR
jgi:hypothetical protein